MEYKESPGICGMERRFIVPEVTWLDKKMFEEYMKKGKRIDPNINNEIFVGKSLPNSRDKWYSHRSNDSRPDSLGSVMKTQTGQWRLMATSPSHYVQEFDENFLVLCLHDVAHFQWVKTSYINIPKFALRGAVTNEYLYIGQTLEKSGGTNELDDEVVYLTNTNDRRLVQRQFSDPIPQIFGKYFLFDIMYE
jgi:hypothetical protein